MATPTPENNYVGDGSTVLYSFTFPYISTEDIEVTLDGVLTTEYTFANVTTVEFNTAPAVGVDIRIYRNTDVSTIENVFYPGSAVRAKDLNDNFTQSLYVVQEATFNTSKATEDAAEALATANAADVKADQALTQSAAAEASANQAQTDASQAATDALQAAASASDAAADASAAQISADQANTAIQTAAIFTPIANVAAIPASPDDQDRVSVLDSTGIDSFTPLTGLPVGPTYNSGAYVNIIYQNAQSTWSFVSYGSNDPDARYLLDLADTVGTSNIIDDAITTDKLIDDSVTTDKLADDAVTIAKLDRAYVEKAGDTMTGDLTVPNIDTTTVQADTSVTTGTPGVGTTGILLDTSTANKPQITLTAVSGATSGSIGLNTSGTGVGALSITTANSLQLGGNASTYFSGNVPTTTSSGPSFARLNSEGFGLRLYRSTSLRASKEDIRDLAAPIDLCKALRPVLFKSALENDKKMFHGDEDQIGFIAEEVEQVHTGLCTYDGKELSGVTYDRIGAVAIGALKEAIARIEALEAEVRILKGGT
uniref:Tail tubular protein B n=1 Tax=uncultured marine virus TaxID=186617 RepID=A0A0F7LBJ1_9VIRU|nr:tail tubular protein B [uncultured marine virus]